MSNELFLELGDIIQIQAPSNSIINNRIYFIDYIDQKIIYLIDDTSLEKISFNIDDKGKLSDESIESITILSRSDEKGYARQNDLSIDKWVSIHIGGDMPSIITGQITNLEEDMIEVTTFPKKEIMYIDFGYQGIPLNIPFEKITLREQPKQSTIYQEQTAQNHEEEDEPEKEEEDVALRIKEVLFEADEIEFGEDLEEITELVNVPIEERRYDIQIQKNDILDDLLSTIPVTNRTKNVLNDIHKMIERFIQLRKDFSFFDESGLSVSKKKINIKPLLDNIKELKKNIPKWFLPIVKNKKKIYDIDNDDEDTYEDVEKINFKEEIFAFIEKFPYLQKREERKKEINERVSGRNQYDYMISELNNFLIPFFRTDVRNDIIIEKETNIDIDTVVHNFDNFNSTAAWSHETSNAWQNTEPAEFSSIKQAQFCVQRYNIGQKRIQIEKLDNFQTKTNFINITRNDNLDIMGYVLLPTPVINYSRIKNPKTNIKTRAQLNMIYFGYNSLLTSIKNKIVDHSILDIENPYIYSMNNATTMTLDPNIEDENKYEKFLNTIIPDTDKLLESCNTEDRVSFTKILYTLEPFHIYGDNINHNIYKKILQMVETEITKNKKKIIQYNTENDSYIKHNFNVEIKKELLFTNHDELKEIYDIKTKYNSEIFRKILTLDNAQTFMTFMSLQDLDLHSTVNIDQIAEEGLEETNKEDVQENRCENYILTKEYFDIHQLNQDDGKDEIFYDKKYDITHYEILEEFRLEKSTLEEGEFKDFLFNHLKKNVGMSEKDAFEEMEAILTGKRKVREGQYSIIKNPETSKIIYYKRVGTQWILDEEIQDKEIGDLFCNLRNKCLKINKKCVDENISKSQFNKKLLKQMMEHFDREFYLSKEELREKLKTDLKENILSIQKLLKLKLIQKLSYDREKLEIGWALEQSEGLIKSPYEELRDNILGQADFVKKQNDIILFTDKYCRKEETDSFWYYCIDTNIPLIPTFYRSLANAYKSGKYIDKLNEIERDRGTKSDDGGYIVDKYSGYLIRAINFDISEGYEESGAKRSSREEIEQDVKEITMRQIVQKKKEDTEDVKKIKSVIIKISEDMGISLEKDFNFIINNVTNSMETDSALIKAVGKKEGKAREKLRDMYLLTYTLAYLIISIQTIIPIPKSKKSFPGCKESFGGFPLNDDDTDLSLIEYLSCIVTKIKANIGIWKVLRKQKEETTKKNVLKVIKVKVLEKDHIKLRLKTRREYVPEVELVPTYIDVKNWSTFLPPLRQLKIPKVRGLGGGFMGSFNSNIRSGNKEQFSQLSEISGKIIYFSLNIQEHIQEVVHHETPLLTSIENVPFLENVCCNEGEKNVLLYFIEKDKSIGSLNNQVNELTFAYNSYKQLSKARTIYDSNNTKLIYPELEKDFSNETIYKAFLHYCNFNKGLPDELMHLCISSESSITEDDTFDEKVQKLKDEGKNFTNEHLIELLSIIARSNIIKTKDRDDIFHPHQFLIALLDHFLVKDDVNVDKNLIGLLKILTDSFDVLDWQGEGESDEYKSVIKLKNFLRKANDEMRKKLLEFIKEHGGLSKKKFEIVRNFLDTIQEWKERGNGIFMDNYDENSFFIFDFFKQAIRDIATIYPSILINRVKYEHAPIPSHWGLSSQHIKLLQKHIEEELNKSKDNINRPSSYDLQGCLDFMLKKIKKESADLLSLMERTPFFSKINGIDTIFDCSIVKDIGEFYLLTVLNMYVSYSDQIVIPKTIKESDDIDAISVDSVGNDDKGVDTLLDIELGRKEEAAQAITNLLVSYINILVKRKDNLNYNNDSINEITLSSKIKETKRITKHYKDLPDEVRKVQKLHQNLKLGNWGIGQTTAVHQYNPDQFENELAVFLSQSRIERGEGGEDEVTGRLRGILTDADIHDMDMTARQQADNAIQMSLLGDDDDHGERDGDEAF